MLSTLDPLSDFSLIAILHDKKASNQNCSVVFVNRLGEGEIAEWSMEQVLERLE